MNTLRLFLIALISLTFLSLNAQVTIYNNFGEGHDGWDYNYGLGWTISGDSVQNQYGVEQAMGFEAAGSGFVTDIWVAISYVPSSAYSDTVTVRLVENPQGLPPDTAFIMEEWVLTDFDDWYQWNEPIHLIGSNTSELISGNSYWLWAIAADRTWTMWCMNEDPSLTCPHTIRREGENWLSVSNETVSAFRIDVSPGIGIYEDTQNRKLGSLSQNYPNPVFSHTIIPYSINETARVKLVIVDILGEERMVLVDEFHSQGNYSCSLDVTGLNAGIYLIELISGEQLIEMKRMIIAR